MRLAIQILLVLLLVGSLVTPRLRWRRASFAGFAALGLASFAVRAGWPARPFAPRACEGLVGSELALHSFRNTPHILLFALCFCVARAQVGAEIVDGRGRWRAGAGAFALTVVIGALVELAEAASGAGHCRLRDLLPDAAGALLGWAALGMIAAAWARWGWAATRGRA
jgi:hypothetical protein